MTDGVAHSIVANMAVLGSSPRTPNRSYNLVYLFPLVWRPTKLNFIRRGLEFPRVSGPAYY